MSPITVRGIGIEAKGDHQLATFTLSETPGQAWIAFFRERANGSLLNIQSATVRKNRLPGRDPDFVRLVAERKRRRASADRN